MLIAKELAITLVAAMIIRLDDFDNFIECLLQLIYSKTIVVFLAWLVFGNASLFVSAFALSMVMTFLLIDFEDIEERFDELKNL